MNLPSFVRSGLLLGVVFLLVSVAIDLLGLTYVVMPTVTYAMSRVAAPVR